MVARCPIQLPPTFVHLCSCSFATVSHNKCLALD